MKCESCGDDADQLYSLFFRSGSGFLFSCERCLRMFKQFQTAYAAKGYTKDRVYDILQTIIARHKRDGKWPA
jgi:hypothetical protein